MATETNKTAKKSLFKVAKLENEAVIVLVDGWRMRAYFDKDAKKEGIVAGSFIELEHYGEATKPHEIEFLKIK